jgi:ketosteroid isomerase-like protein
MTTSDQHPDIQALLKREEQRCQALASGDFELLGDVLSRDLLHTHTRGNSDGYDSYLVYMQSTLELLNVERGELRVRQYGDAAVMTGVQVNTARLREGDGTVMRIESKAIQVWAKEADGQWRLTVFQATALGPPTPVNTN